ncbi:MAG: pyridoxamine 5'-phosphate oxidase family protein [Chloroflexota bacterium]
MTPQTELDGRYSSPGAVATPWPEGEKHLEQAEIYWISTVRANGQPHVTPVIALWQDDALYFCTGPAEQKARNLGANPRCTLTTGNNSMENGLDIVLEGVASRETNEEQLRRLAGAYRSKYGWEFTVRDGAFFNDAAGEAFVFQVKPDNVYGFGKGERFSHTRWTF